MTGKNSIFLTSPTSESESLQTITWSIVSGFKGLKNDVDILAALTDIEVVVHEDCDDGSARWSGRRG